MVRLLVFALLLTLCQHSITAVHCGGANRHSCRNVFTARQCGVLDECVEIWRTSLWEKYRNDTSAKCTVCRTLATSLPISQLQPLCSMLGMSDIPECENAIEELPKKLELNSATKITKPRDVDILCNTLTACETDLYIGGLDFGSVICEDCKKLIKTVQDFFADNATAEAIIWELDSRICDNLNEHVRDYCKQTVKVHVPVILHLIEVHLGPDDICSLLRLCPQSRYSTVTLSQLLDQANRGQLNAVSSNNGQLCSGSMSYSWINRPNRQNSYMFTSYGPLNVASFTTPPDCATCIAVMDQMKESIRNPAFQNEIKKDMEEQICGSLGFIREVCIRAIDKHFDEMVKEVENFDSYKACSVFKMCGPKAVRPQVVIQSSVQSSPGVPGVCQLCELVIEKLIDVLVDEPTEASINDALEKLCDLVPQYYHKRCENFVQNFGAQIVEAIIKGTAPTLACTSIGLCTGPLAKPLVLTPFSPPLQTSTSQPVTNVGVSSYCSTCKALVEIAYKELQRNETEEQLKRLVKAGCSLLPSSYIAECEQLVDEYLPVVIDYLEQSMDPEAVCEQIGFCPEEAGALKTLCLRGPAYWCLNAETAKRCNATSICSSQWINQLSAQQLCSPQNRAQICASHELSAVCGLTRECLEQRMMTYLQSVSHLLGLRPQIGITNIIQTRDKLNCSVCVDVLNEWTTSRKFLGSPFFTVQICTKYTNPLDREQCDRVWRHRYTIFRRMLRSNAKPEVVCQQMNLCHVPAVVSSSPCLDNPFYAISSRRAAEQCGTLDLWLQLQQLESTPAPINTNALTTVMETNSPELNRPECQTDPARFCQSLERAQLCGDSGVRYCQQRVWYGSQPRPVVTSQPLLGRYRCNWGPSYWCSSLESARSCGEEAVSYCIRRGMFV